MPILHGRESPYIITIITLIVITTTIIMITMIIGRRTISKHHSNFRTSSIIPIRFYVVFTKYAVFLFSVPWSDGR